MAVGHKLARRRAGLVHAGSLDHSGCHRPAARAGVCELSEVSAAMSWQMVEICLIRKYGVSRGRASWTEVGAEAWHELLPDYWMLVSEAAGQSGLQGRECAFE